MVHIKGYYLSKNFSDFFFFFFFFFLQAVQTFIMSLFAKVPVYGFPVYKGLRNLAPHKTLSLSTRKPVFKVRPGKKANYLLIHINQASRWKCVIINEFSYLTIKTYVVALFWAPKTNVKTYGL